MFTSNMNSGYSGWSMSNRAVEAYDNDEMPISKWTKGTIISCIEDLDEHKAELFKKVRLPILKQHVLTYTGWHHTSSYCNGTDFYGIDEDYILEVTDEEILELASIKPEKKTVESNKFRGDIGYLEWSGTRNHPKAKRCLLEDVNIEERGCFYYVTDDNGKQLLKKKINSNGTYVSNYQKIAEAKRLEEERKQRLRDNSSKEAIEFYESLGSYFTTSMSNHIYKYDRKPSRDDYEEGLHKFFEVGEHRLYHDRDKERLILETWNGSEWIAEA